MTLRKLHLIISNVLYMIY